MEKKQAVSYSIIITLWLVTVASISGIGQASAETQTEQMISDQTRVASLSVPIVQPQSMPSVTIVSPVPNQQFGMGQPITVVSNSSDPLGIVRISLVANGQVVASLYGRTKTQKI